MGCHCRLHPSQCLPTLLHAETTVSLASVYLCQTSAQPWKVGHQCMCPPCIHIRGFPDSSVDKKKSACNEGDPGLIIRTGRSAGEGIGYQPQYCWASLVAQLVKNLPAMWETWVRCLGLGRSPGEGKGYPLQYYGLENSMDCTVHGVGKSWTRLSDFHFTSLHTQNVG